jgi:hypothetical protein
VKKEKKRGKKNKEKERKKTSEKGGKKITQTREEKNWKGKKVRRKK